MGGVVELNTREAAQPGLHGETVFSGGSFDTAGGFGKAQYTWGRNTIDASANGSCTDRYLNPVVPQNYSNTGTVGDFSLGAQRSISNMDRVSATVRREFARYDIPNEQVQQAAGQRQTADSVETMGTTSWQHIFSAHALAEVNGMGRDNGHDFNSNGLSTPIEVFQQNHFREGYVKAAITATRGPHEFKFGIESDNLQLHEDFRYTITDSTQFEDETPQSFSFSGHRPDLEQSAFIEDLFHHGNWTLGAGLRWDHYQLLLNRHAVEPRLSIARYFPAAGMVVHVSYDRVFQTPSFDNILLSSSDQIESLSPDTFLRLPVQPSTGDYYEAGVSKAFRQRLRIDANTFRRYERNFADDDQISNTAVSFPIAFRKAVVYGVEAKVEVPSWGRFSGFTSYSWQVGNAWNPVTGGLFLGDNAAAAEQQLSGHFPISQDQRNTLRTRVRYQMDSRVWIAGGASYDSGLPFQFDGDRSTVLAEYGQQVLDRVNFDRGRIRPVLQVDASAGVVLRRVDKATVQLQADGENLTNVLDVLDFGGIFSGNAIGPPRSGMLRLTATF